MKVLEYLRDASTETEFEALVSAIPNDQQNVRIFPIGQPGLHHDGLVVHRDDIIDISATHNYVFQGTRAGLAARIKIRSSALAPLADEVWYIDWQSLIEDRVLPDGDRIHVDFEALEPNTLGGEVRLVLGRDITWWKQVEVYGLIQGSYDRIAHVEAQDNHDPHDAAFTNGGLRDGRLLLWKAKEFGIHKPKYVLSNVYERLMAQRATFTWLDD